MTIKPIFKVLAALVMTGMLCGANAASISFDMGLYIANPGDTVSVTVNYDFIDTPAFGGGFNVIYDPNVLQFVSYTQRALDGAPGTPQAGGSPIGMLAAPGSYENAGMGTFDFFNGINTADSIGTFVFNVLGAGGDAGCGATLCLTPVTGNPMTALDNMAGFNMDGDITSEVFGNGITAANVVPVPAAVWFMLSGLGALLGFGRRSA